MTVKELMEKLSKYDPEAEVFRCAFRGYGQVDVINEVGQSQSRNYVMIYTGQQMQEKG